MRSNRGRMGSMSEKNISRKFAAQRSSKLMWHRRPRPNTLDSLLNKALHLSVSEVPKFSAIIAVRPTGGAN